MAHEAQDRDWPLPKFTFSVDIAGVGTNLRFQEVSGLDLDSQPIEYQRGESPSFAPIKMPGIRKSGNITLKRGVFADDKLFAWLDGVERNAARRSTVTIRVLDERGNRTMTWNLSNAWPTKFSATDLAAGGNEVAIETIELAYEGLTIENA